MKALVTDLDGTLLNDYKQVGNKDLDTLHQLGKEGIIRIVATGRSLYSFNEVISADFPIDYLIFSAGGGTYDFLKKEILQSHFITGEQVIKNVKILEELKVDYQVRSKIPHSHKYLFKQFSKHNPDFERLNKLYNDHISEVIDINKLEDSSRIIVIAQSEHIVKLIENNFAENCIIRATSPIDNKSVWMEIYPKNVNKGSALTNLCKKLNISLSNTIGVGNDYNDIHFLDITDKKFVVSGSPNSLKEKYTTIVSNNDNPITYIINNNL